MRDALRHGVGRGAATVAAVALLLCARPARPDELARRELDSIERAQGIVAPKVEDRRRDWLRTLAAAYRLLRPQPSRAWTDHHSLATRTWRRAWLRQLIRIKKRELTALNRELDLLQASHERVARARRAGPAELTQSLTWPVSGDVALPMGRYHHASGATLERRGIELSTHPGEAVVAPLAGTVRYRGVIRGLGPALVIMSDAGESAILGRVRGGAPVGTVVTAGQPVGSAYAEHLFLEIRVGPAGGRPIDPLPHLTHR